MQINQITALVTGGASGLGRATVRELHTRGARVVICDIQDSSGLASELGERTCCVRCDVTSSQQVSAAVEEAVQRFGGLHAAVNCAGVAWAQRAVNREGQPHDLELFEQVLRINLTGTFNVCRLAASQMIRQDSLGQERGVLINTASVAAFDGQVGQAAYAASKGGVASLSLPLARDLAKHGIRCMAVAPGLFDTPMAAELPSDKVNSMLAWAVHPKRTGHPSEFAALVAHIVENPYLNGETIKITGAIRLPPR